MIPFLDLELVLELVLGLGLGLELGLRGESHDETRRILLRLVERG